MKRLKEYISRLRNEIQIPVDKQLESASLREKFAKRDRKIGMYSYGCFDVTRIGRNVTIGRYCSFADTARIYTRNHGIEYISTTPYLYNPSIVSADVSKIDFLPCLIEDDVWVGHNAIILPSVGFIGRGSIIGAGAVVTKRVERYSIVAGNPARKVRERFSSKVCNRIEESRWWEWDIAKLRQQMQLQSQMIFSPADYFDENTLDERI